MITTTSKPLNAITLPEALELLAYYANAEAIWWMEPRIELPRRNLKTDLVIARVEHELARRTLLSTVYPLFIRRLTQQPEQPFPIPHALDQVYEDETRLAPLRKQGLFLTKKLPDLLNKMLRRQYLLEDAGLATPAARTWHAQAQKLDATAGWLPLRAIIKSVGAPVYLYHSSQLASLVETAATAFQQIKDFLAAPYPGPAHPDKLDGAANGERRWYWKYANDGIRIGWDPDNSPGLPDDYRESPEEEEKDHEEEPVKGLYISRDDIREELVEIRQQIDRLLALL
jgi:hypothetical protein